MNCWMVRDSEIGISLWSNEKDARLVVKHRKSPCTTEPAVASAGDVVSTLGAPDSRIQP